MELEAETALPYRDDERAAAGLRAELRHRAADDDLTPEWDTMIVSGPTTTPDAHGRAWSTYRATVQTRGR